jgi:hypothetical protein
VYRKCPLTVLLILLPMPCRLQFIFFVITGRLPRCVGINVSVLIQLSKSAHMISHSFQIYCFTENIEAKSILWHPSFCYLLCIVGKGSGSEVGDYCQKNKLSDCRNPTVSKAEVTGIPVYVLIHTSRMYVILHVVLWYC